MHLYDHYFLLKFKIIYYKGLVYTLAQNSLFVL